MATLQFKAKSEIEEWLEGKPADWGKAIAARAAMRSLPYLNHAQPAWLEEFAVVPFRALIFSWLAVSTPTILKGTAAPERAASAVSKVLSKRNSSGSLSSELAADAAYLAALGNAGQAIKSSAEAAANFVHLERPHKDDFHFIADFPDDPAGHIMKNMWDAVSKDCEWLLSQNNQFSAARKLSFKNIWLDKNFDTWIPSLWLLETQLRSIDENYFIWHQWLEDRIHGEPSAFDIPGDKRRVEDKKILRRLAEATDEDFWDKGHEYVNATLKSWLDDARARVAPRPSAEILNVPNGQSFETVAETLLQQASPQAQINDGKLDAAPNTIFDKPQYSDNLAELPSELLAYTNTILNSLPPNCAAIVRNSFTGFRDEMLVRGNRPILNILKAMAASLIVELYGNPPADTSPDEWGLRDPREWGEGFHSMFGYFFKGYHDLIHHFPLDTEREDFIAATPIDEIAASGEALTAPVDVVAALILDLGKQGFATDNIVRIIEAHQIYNRDIAQLPSPDADSNVVTPKRRHVLATAGFYLNTYSVLGTTASLYALQTVPAVQALMPTLKAAADALLAFVR